MTEKENKMATKKTSKQRAGSPKKSVLQTDDPIIIKPGSVVIEVDEKFDDFTQSGGRRRFKHRLEPNLTEVWILNDTSGRRDHYRLNPGDRVEVCYDGCLNCPAQA